MATNPKESFVFYVDRMHSVDDENRLHYSSLSLAFERGLKKLCPDAKLLASKDEPVREKKCLASGTSENKIEYGIWAFQLNKLAK